MSPTARSLLMFLTALAVLAAALVPAASGRSLRERIESKQRQVDRAERREGVLTSTVRRYDQRIRRLESEVAGLRSREAGAQARLEASQRRLDEARRELRAGRERLATLRRDLARSVRTLEKRLVAIYKTGDPDVLTVVLEADGFADLLDRTEFLSRIGDQDARVIGRVRSLRNEARATVKRLTALEARMERSRDEIAATRRELAQARGNLESRRTALAGVRSKRRSSLAAVRDRKRTYEGELHGLEAHERKIQARLARVAGGAPGPVRRGSGGMVWPVSGSIVSPFGQRWGRLHAGVDIAAPAGTPIRAARAGNVVLAAPTSGYGNYMCVSHGGGLSTCYAHLSSYAARAGARVRGGQVIGAVGCTGRCYGDHLHFEVRVGGRPTDPMGYL